MNPEPLILVGTVALIALCAVTAILARVLVVPAPPRRGQARGPDGRFARTPRHSSRRRLDQSGRVELVRPPAWTSASDPRPQGPREARSSTHERARSLTAPQIRTASGGWGELREVIYEPRTRVLRDKQRRRV
jgi:hypothetical protein